MSGGAVKGTAGDRSANTGMSRGGGDHVTPPTTLLDIFF